MRVAPDVVLRFTKEDEAEVIKYFGKTEEEENQLVQELIEWRNAQPHLPKDGDTDHFLSMLRLNKLRLEKAKEKIDNYYSYRNVYPEFYDDRDLLNPRLQQILDIGIMLPLPKLSENKYRVDIIKLKSFEVYDLECHELAKIIFAFADVRLKYDRNVADIYVADLAGAHMGHLLKINIFLAKKAINVMRGVFSNRIHSVHVINFPAFAMYMLPVAKALVPKKLFDRLKIHDSVDELKNFIDEDVLPEEFGGTAGPVEDLYKKWRQFMEEHNDWCKEEALKRSNEALRPKDNSTYMSKFMNMFSSTSLEQQPQ